MKGGVEDQFFQDSSLVCEYPIIRSQMIHVRVVRSIGLHGCLGSIGKAW